MSLGPLYVFLGEVLFKSFAHFLIGLFVFLEWSRVSSLYILEIRPLSEVSLENMFSHTVGSLGNLVLFSLAMQKLFILMRSHLFILSFMSLALWDASVRMLLRGISEIFLPMFSSRTFMVLRLIFKSFTHPEFIFIQLQLSAFSPHPSTPPQPVPPPSPTTLPLDFVLVSFIVAPVDPPPHFPLPTPLWLLLHCS